METHLNDDSTKESDCHKAHSLRHCGIENGNMVSHLGDVEDVVVGSGSGGVDERNGATTLCPITPIPRRKNGKSLLVIGTPLSLESPRALTVEGFDSVSSDEDSPRTPEQGVFNPFAPGPERMCLAPVKKLVKERTRIVARRLDFDHVVDPIGLIEDDKEADILLENMLVEIVYETILEAILSKQTEDFLAENQSSELSGCCTPTSPVPLSGISNTCPGAPPKATVRKSVNIDPSLCRKLEF